MFLTLRILKIISVTALVFTISTILFLNISPEFGSNPSSVQKKIYSTFFNYVDGEFKNNQETPLFTDKMSTYDFFKGHPNQVPAKDIIPNKIDIKSFIKDDIDKIKISWLGHSAFLINIDGKIVMLDPMLGKYAAPVPMPTLKRYSSKIAFSVEELDTIDIVIYSHDHYDHLDYPTIKKIKDKVGMFVVPYGVGNHLKGWGVRESSITELNWGESTKLHGEEYICLPARHFSGRGPFNRNSTLWSSWAIKSQYGKIYFSGDSGYGKHLKEIGDTHGPFDFALIDCGQYNKAWKFSHMFPEQSILAAKDLRADYLIPVHWGAFTLSTHSWIEPPEVVTEKASDMNQKIILPQIGQVILMDQQKYDNTKWWRKFH